MTINVGINGFGRIGRSVFRQIVELGDGTDIKVLAVNDLTDNETLAHLLKYDSVWGTFDAEVGFDAESITVDGNRVHASAEKDPAAIGWGELGVDIVIESTGKFTSLDAAAKHLAAGAKKVILSAPGKGVEANFVYGVNDDTYNPETDDIISNASCTTNCLAPLAKALNDAIGIESGVMTTVHAYTGDQNLVDGPHKDLRRGRAAALNIVPTTTGAAAMVGKVIPELEGKLDGGAIRVPVPDGSLVDFTFLPSRDVSVEEVNAAVKQAAETGLGGVLHYSEQELVSTDILGNDSSSIFDSLLTKKVGKLVKVVSWYDNERGYSRRMIDLIGVVGTRL